ncbi:MAG: hypothetical protein J0G95_14585 [Rhizobiales bacterium]|nr:hypothetical protein [Hyphomicrobiales bacterium]
MSRFLAPALACLAVVMITASAQAQTGGSSAGGTGSAGGTSGTGLGSGPPAAPPPGTNSLGTAQSSGGGGRGETSAAPLQDDARDKAVDKKIKSICKGC